MRPTAVPPVVDVKKCTGCKLCVKACPVFVLELKDKKALVSHGDFCIECGHCGAVCPEGAVVQKKTVVAQGLKAGKKYAVSPDVMMQILRERRSVRVYKDKPVPKDIIEKIINAGRYAPTGTNSQRVHYTVITSPEMISELSRRVMEFNAKFFKNLQNRAFVAMMSLFIGRKKIEEFLMYRPVIMHAKEVVDKGGDPMLHNAPVVLIAHAEKWDGSPAINCAVALVYCNLMAHTLGIGACYNGWVENTANISGKLKKWLGIPKDHKCFGVLTMGYQNIEYKRLVERNEPDVKWL